VLPPIVNDVHVNGAANGKHTDDEGEETYRSQANGHTESTDRLEDSAFGSTVSGSTTLLIGRSSRKLGVASGPVDTTSLLESMDSGVEASSLDYAPEMPTVHEDSGFGMLTRGWGIASSSSISSLLLLSSSLLSS
jgi:hypothetical protein